MPPPPRPARGPAHDSSEGARRRGAIGSPAFGGRALPFGERSSKSGRDGPIVARFGPHNLAADRARSSLSRSPQKRGTTHPPAPTPHSSISAHPIALHPISTSVRSSFPFSVSISIGELESARGGWGFPFGDVEGRSSPSAARLPGPERATMAGPPAIPGAFPERQARPPGSRRPISSAPDQGRAPRARTSCRPRGAGATFCSSARAPRPRRPALQMRRPSDGTSASPSRRPPGRRRPSRPGREEQRRRRHEPERRPSGVQRQQQRRRRPPPATSAASSRLGRLRSGLRRVRMTKIPAPAWPATRRTSRSGTAPRRRGSTRSRTKKVRKSKTELTGPITSMKRRMKLMSQRCGRADEVVVHAVHRDRHLARGRRGSC